SNSLPRAEMSGCVSTARAVVRSFAFRIADKESTTVSFHTSLTAFDRRIAAPFEDTEVWVLGLPSHTTLLNYTAAAFTPEVSAKTEERPSRSTFPVCPLRNQQPLNR